MTILRASGFYRSGERTAVFSLFLYSILVLRVVHVPFFLPLAFSDAANAHVMKTIELRMKGERDDEDKKWG